MQLVDRTFECNVHRFKMLIDKLKPTNSLDFKMLHGLLEQRHHQIAELLADGKELSLTLLDFISIEDILAKISEAARTKGTAVIEIPEQISVAEVVHILLVMF
jgi:hypothetical protein